MTNEPEIIEADAIPRILVTNGMDRHPNDWASWRVTAKVTVRAQPMRALDEYFFVRTFVIKPEAQTKESVLKEVKAIAIRCKAKKVEIYEISRPMTDDERALVKEINEKNALSKTDWKRKFAAAQGQEFQTG